MKNTIALLLLAVTVSLFIPADAVAQKGRIIDTVKQLGSSPSPNEKPVVNALTNSDANRKDIDSRAKPDADQSTKYAYAVLIGVNQYRTPGFKPLTCCVNDMKALRNALVKAQFAKEQDIALLCDESDDAHKPTAENIRKHLDEVNAKAKPGDMVLVAFSGHGIALPMTTDNVTTFQSYLCPADAEIVYDGKKKEWNTGGTLIPIKELFDPAPAKAEVFKIAILDACRNAALIMDGNTVKSVNHTAAVPEELAQKSVESRTRIETELENALLEDVVFNENDLMSFDNLFRFSGCRRGQVSWEAPGTQHGVFTKFILEALSGKADEPMGTFGPNGQAIVGDGDGDISFFEVTSYVARETQKYAREVLGKTQKPSMCASETSAAIVIGYSPQKKVDFDKRTSLFAADQSSGRGLSIEQKLDRVNTVMSIINTASGGRFNWQRLVRDRIKLPSWVPYIL
jgi:uncharacterized caspase-like protein